MVPDYLTIAEAAPLIEKRELSPVELVNSRLDRIARLDGRLHSFIRVLADAARHEARATEAEIAAGKYRGPLHGIPIGLKDIYETAGVATTGHSKVMQDHVPQKDAFSVQRLREAGAIVVGKLATHEFALGGPSFDLSWPPARNPWDLSRFTGGSSSGTGAAVAAGLVLGGTGSDTGGSIRGPAAYCGLAGIKPTYGLISRTGILPLAFSLDHAGPLAWTAEMARSCCRRWPVTTQPTRPAPTTRSPTIVPRSSVMRTACALVSCVISTSATTRPTPRPARRSRPPCGRWRGSAALCAR
jgi:aspartyl-tRNA(Asn)/glutamyl-tRNA(Gln) amidotransferase subunit A